MQDDKVPSNAPLASNVKPDHASSAMIIDSSQGSDQNMTTAAVIHNKNEQNRRNCVSDNRGSRSSYERPNSKIVNNQGGGQEIVEAQMINLDKTRTEKQGDGAGAKQKTHTPDRSKDVVALGEYPPQGYAQARNQLVSGSSHNPQIIGNSMNQNNQNVNPNIMNGNHQNGYHNGGQQFNGNGLPNNVHIGGTKKRTLDQISNSNVSQHGINNASPQSQRGMAAPTDQNDEHQLLALYRQNFCPCCQPACKDALQRKMKQLLKQNETFTQMQSLLYGCPRTNRQINILTMILKKIHIQEYEDKEMDALLDLFIVVYYKCSQEVQLTLLDDIDKCMSLISECNLFKGLSGDSRFSFTLFFFELFKFQNCMKMEQKNAGQQQEANGGAKPCSVMSLSKIKERCKRYDPNQNKKSKIKMAVEQCEVHGVVDQQSATFQCNSAPKFVSFTCFLIQFKFKLLNIEDIAQTEKDRQRKEMCNIIKCMIQECDPSLYYYPMRALQEFYYQEVSEKSLGKRLSSESFQQYKLKKERQGRNNLLTDFKKLSLVSKQSSNSFQHHQYQSYLLIYHDTIELIRKVIGQCKYHCYIVCLKILQKLSKIQKSAWIAGHVFDSGEFCSRQQLINFKVECLQAMVSHGRLSQLCDREKQMFYEEVKELIREVQEGWAQRESLAIERRRERKTLSSNCNDSDSDIFDNSQQQMDRSGGIAYHSNRADLYHQGMSYQNQQVYGMRNNGMIGSPCFAKQPLGINSRSRSLSSLNPNDSLKEECFNHDRQVGTTNHADLSILEPLLTIDTINEFPKLSLLVFQSMRPIMPIFNNNYLQILEKCERAQLFKFDHLDKNKKQENNDGQVSDSKLKKFNCTGRRETMITTWMSGQKYRTELERRVNQYLQMQNNSINNVNGQQIGSSKKGEILQLADHRAEIKRLCRLRRKFTSNEIVFVFDFLLVMCRHAIYRKDPIAIGIGTHLIQDFHEKTYHLFNESILVNINITSELLALNFEMRSKKFIEEQRIHNGLMSEDETPKDELFSQLFDKVFKLIKNPALQPQISDSFDFNRAAGKQPGMSSYTSTFFKQIIRIFQTSRKFLNIDYVKPLIDQLIMGNTAQATSNDHQLLVIVNSLPLYLAIQMFFDPNQIGVPSGINKEMVEQNDGGLSYKVWEVMKCEIEKIKDRVDAGKNIENPILMMQRISNLIHVSTTMLQYLLCFQTPLNEKSSSSQIHSNNSQNQFSLSPIQKNNNQVSSQKSLPNFNNLQANLAATNSNVLVPGITGQAQSPFNVNHLSAQLQLHQQLNQQKKSKNQGSVGQGAAQSLHQASTGGVGNSFTDEMYENTFLIKRQKYCNFCSTQVPLPHPTSFTFSRKCANCSMKNSCLLMPARFLCNMCIDHNNKNLYRCEREEIPLEGVREAPVLHSTAQVKIIQRVITEALTIWQLDVQRWKASQSFWESSEIGCVDKCCEKKYMYSNILAIMVSRMLKLMLWVLKHRLLPEPELLKKFNEMEAMEEKLTTGFQHIKKRIQLVKKELKKIELESESKDQILNF